MEAKPLPTPSFPYAFFNHLFKQANPHLVAVSPDQTQLAIVLTNATLQIYSAAKFLFMIRLKEELTVGDIGTIGLPEYEQVEEMLWAMEPTGKSLLVCYGVSRETKEKIRGFALLGLALKEYLYRCLCYSRGREWKACCSESAFVDAIWKIQKQRAN